MSVFARIAFLVAILFSAFALAQTTSSVSIGPNTTVCTNFIRNNSMQGAVPSTTTLPNNWSVVNSVGGTQTTTVNSVTSVSGLDVINLNVAGTAAAAGTYRLVFESATQIAATVGQTWASSAYYTVTAGSFPGAQGVGFQSLNGGGTLLSTYEASPTIGSGAIASQQYSQIALVTDATAAFVRPSFSFFVPGAGAYNVTFSLASPQLQPGASVTLPTIRTTNSAVSAFCR